MHSDWNHMPLELYDAAWAMLKEATINRRKPCHLMNVATIGLDGRPKVRTVVLRDADVAGLTIRFHTDARSQKVAELAANPNIEAHFYDQPANIQIRLSGMALVEATDQPTARQAWGEAKAMSKVCYRLDAGPGSALEAGDGYGYLKHEAGEADPGEAQFRTVTIKVERMDMVVLKIEANRRAVFEMSGGEIEGRWVVP
jgi:pyridoxamine 5'-phosphate oxidase